MPEQHRMRFLLDIAYLFAVLAYAPVMLYRMIACGRYRTGWAHRFGKVGRRGSGGRCIWIHAVSLGEINATRTVVAELKQRLGDCEIVISTTTDTGMERARALFAVDHEVFYFPLDFSFISRRAFRRLRPDLCLLMELEVWPNFLASARKFGAQVVVVNGRISEHSFKWYRRIRPISKAIFRRLSLVLVQTDLYAKRFRRIGCASERVVVTGSLKYDTAQIADSVPGAEILAAQLGITADQRLLVAGATGNDEEKILLDVYRRLIEEPQFQDVRFVLVPRKPERFDEVARQIQQAGFDLVRYSQVREHKSARAQEHKSTRAQEAGDEGRGTRDEGRGARDEGRGTRDEGGSLSRSEGLPPPALAFGKGRHPDGIPGVNNETRNTQCELQRGLVHGHYSEVKECESTRAQEARDEGRGARDEGGSLSRSEGLDRPALASGKGRHPDGIPGANNETRNTQCELQRGLVHGRYSEVKECESTRAQEARDEGRGTREEGGSLSRSEGLDRPALASGKGRHPDEIPGASDETRNTQCELQRDLVHGQSRHVAPGPAAQGRDAPATGDERQDTKYGVILGDTMGDLRKFYSLASVIFVGRSLVPMGGSDMMEAAALGRPTVFGPHATNFRQTVEALLAEGGAICVRNTEDLLAALRRCLGDPDYAAGIARNGRAVIRSNQGATRKTVDAIAALLNPPDESDESHRSGGA